MTERERLIEILLDGVTFTDQYEQHEILQAEYMADNLLANGVIAPPVKIGQTVYDYAGRECTVFSIHFYNEGIPVFATERYGYNGIRIHTTHSFHKIGQTVFLTRDEAERR